MEKEKYKLKIVLSLHPTDPHDLNNELEEVVTGLSAKIINLSSFINAEFADRLDILSNVFQSAVDNFDYDLDGFLSRRGII